MTPTTDNDDESVLGTYVATDVDEGDRTAGDAVDTTKVKLSLGGDDAGAFKLGCMTETLRRRAQVRGRSPNFESPADADGNNVYKVSIIATDDDGATGKRDVTITVSNIDEAGTVSLSPIQPAIGRPLMATLTDPRRRRKQPQVAVVQRHQPDGYGTDAIDDATTDHVHAEGYGSCGRGRPRDADH